MPVSPKITTSFVGAYDLLHKWFRSVLAEKSRLSKTDVLELLYFTKQLARQPWTPSPAT